jgi:hypothetical protein
VDLQPEIRLNSFFMPLRSVKIALGNPNGDDRIVVKQSFCSLYGSFMPATPRSYQRLNQGLLFTADQVLVSRNINGMEMDLGAFQ